VVERCRHWMVGERPEHMTELLLAFFDETSMAALAS
jgi:hypothetical protein